MSDATTTFVAIFAVLTTVALAVMGARLIDMSRRLDVLGAQLVNVTLERAARVKRPFSTAVRRGLAPTQRSQAIMTGTATYVY